MKDCSSVPNEWSKIANEYRSNDAAHCGTVPGRARYAPERVANGGLRNGRTDRWHVCRMVAQIMTIIMGIDPGISGAVAFYFPMVPQPHVGR
jgi:hypothetical protein